MDQRKATGIDEPSVKFLKLAAIVIDIAAKVYQKPSFLKPGKSQVDNFRRISVLLVLSKVLERPVHKALYRSSYLTFYELLSNRQFGFRSRHSRATSLAHLYGINYQNIVRHIPQGFKVYRYLSKMFVNCT